MTTITRPLLRYHGGKWKLAPWIIQHFPPHRIYVESYGGAGSVLLRKPRAYSEVYNDLDGEVVNLFRVVRNPAQARELVRLVKLTPFARDEFEESYLVDGDPVEWARRTIVRSFMGYGSGSASGQNTGFRNNANRSGTTPAHDWMHLPDALEKTIERLRGVVIEHRPAIEVMRIFDREDCLHYIDPPYTAETRDSGSDYRHEMNSADHEEMAATLRSLTGMAIVSGYRCELYDRLFAGWQRVDRSAHADGARDRIESLWISPNAIRRPSLFDEVAE